MDSKDDLTKTNERINNYPHRSQTYANKTKKKGQFSTCHAALSKNSQTNNQRKLSKFNLFTQKGFFVRFGLLSKAQTLEKTMLTINKNVVFIDGCVLGGPLYLTHQTNLLAVITDDIKNR
jgi:hypothetical protein